MIEVHLTGPEEDIRRLAFLGNEYQSRFRFSNIPRQDAVCVTVTGLCNTTPFLASIVNGVFVFTHLSEEICGYTGIDRDMYLLICCLLGLVQWRVLQLNPLMVWEDFVVCETPPLCLYAERNAMEDYALAFERPFVCTPCLEFLRCLGAEPETLALQEVLERVSLPG